MRTITIYISGFLVFLATQCPGLVHYVFVARQSVIQMRMKSELETQCLQTIQQNEETVRWAKPGKEIWIGNSLFDVESVKFSNGVYTFTGLFDKDETSLVNLFKQQNEKSKSGNRLLTAFFHWVKITPGGFVVPGPVETIAISLVTASNNQPLSAVYIGISNPPPEQL